MSLRLWLPLNGDSRNQGVNNYSITTLGTVTYPTGKMGTCLQAGNGNQVVNGLRISSNLTDILANDYSATIWVKPLGSHVHYNGSFLSSGNWNGTKWAFGVSQDNTKVDVLCNGYNIWITCDVPVNTWTHLACVRTSDGRVTLYKNGEYVGYTTRTDHPQSDADFTCVGRETYASGYFSFNGCINDLRVYDHALSAEEVKKISQGLILHYPLNNKGMGLPNLISKSMFNTTPWSSAITNRGIYEGRPCLYVRNNTLYTNTSQGSTTLFPSITFESNTQYTLSVYWRDDVRTDNKNSSLYFRFKYSDGTYSSNIISPAYTVHSWVYNTLTSEAGKTVVGIHTTYGNGGILVISNLKLEKGATATSYSLSNEDIGNSIAEEADISGFGNNGIIHGTFSYTTDTPLYEVSTSMIGNDSNYLEGTLLPAEAKTVSLWIKPTSRSSSMAVFSDKTSTLAIAISSASVIYTDATASTKGFTMTYWIDDDWNHVVVVNDNGTRRCYINGKSASQGSSSTYFVHNANKFWVWNRSYNNSYPYKGALSDLRVYATALTADEVNDLYKNRI